MTHWLFAIPGFAVGATIGYGIILDTINSIYKISAALDEPQSTSFLAAFTSGAAIRANGSGLTYDTSGPDPVVTGGTVTSLEFLDTDGATFATLSGLSPVAATDAFAALSSSSAMTLFQFITGLVDDDTTVTGTAGNDGVVVGAGNDTANMGDGDDAIAKFSAGNLTYDGGAGSDTLSFRAEFGTVYPNAPVQQLVVNLTTGVGQNPYGGTLSLTNVENIIGTNEADDIIGNDEDNIIGDGRFDGGADVISTLGGNDTVKLNPLSSGVTADGGTGTDTLLFQYGSNVHTLDLTNQANNAGLFGGGTFTNFENYVVGPDFATQFGALNFTGSDEGESLSVWSGALSIALNGGNDTLTLLSAISDGSPKAADGGGGTDTLIFRQDLGPNILDLMNQANNTGVFEDGVYTGFETFELLFNEFNGMPVNSGILDFRGGNEANTIRAGIHDDILAGNGGNDILEGRAGNDTLIGGAGGDVLNGGDDADTASYEGSNARVVINLGLNYAASGHAAGDSFVSIENVIGSAFNDRIVGDGGANVLSGGNGNDELRGEGGNDTLMGGAGGDILSGGDGNDTASYESSNARVVINLGMNFAASGHAQGDSFISLESVIGSAFNDRIAGDGGANALSGGGGDDVLIGGAGGDVLNGGEGTDTASYEDSNTRVVINLGLNYAASGHAAGDSFVSIENVIGSSFNDRIVGDAGANVLSGGAGNDELNGGAGNDTLNGGSGNDTLIGGAGGDILNGGEGTDTASYADSNARVVINLGLNYAAGGHAAGDSFVSIENVIGSAFNDRIVGDAGDNILQGGDGNDYLRGEGGNDLLFGGNGDDLFAFGAGDGDDEIGDFVVGSDHLMLNGIIIDSTVELDGNGDSIMDTLVTFSGGGTVLLAGVTGVTDPGDLIA